MSVRPSHKVMQAVYNVKKRWNAGDTLAAVHRTRLSLCELECTYTAWGNVFFRITCTPPLFPDMTDAPPNPNQTHSPGSSCNGSSTSKILANIASAVMLPVSTNPTSVLSMCRCAGIWRILPLALFLTRLCTHLLKSHNTCLALSYKSAFIFFIRSDAAISSISFCIAWCSCLPFFGNSSSRLFISGSYLETRSSSSKKLPLFKASGFSQCPRNGISCFAQNRTRSMTIMMCCLCLSMKDTSLASLFSWLIIFPRPGWWLCLKPSIFPSAAACALLASCLPQPSDKYFQSLKPVLMNLASWAASGKWRQDLQNTASLEKNFEYHLSEKLPSFPDMRVAGNVRSLGWLAGSSIDDRSSRGCDRSSWGTAFVLGCWTLSPITHKTLS